MPIDQKNDGLNGLKPDREFGQAPAAPPTGHDDESTARRLAGIEEKLSQLLDEVADLKHLLKAAPKEAATKSQPGETAPSDHRRTGEPDGHFILDFEAWLSKRKKSKAKGFSAV